ncbi:triose-phosphate isomerase [Patescibacteria group bacterium]|nr:triose-phosphate isomerase [Patescibacteria group bacterium]MBU1967335.1 triose-phosphate isomerase [Patescibacteria group bacterium]MBU2543184.1 triose-phosphate isomerase [Patescibacteria group bacterium]
MPKLFVANWKSNKSLEEVKQWLNDFHVELKDNQKVVIAPPYPLLSLVADKIKDLPRVFLAVQNLSSFPAGSYTGEVCMRNLEGLGVKYAILGHSERRRYLKESHQDVANKISQALSNGATPIVCVDQDYIEDQARVIEPNLLNQCVVAYEPLAAIGTGENAPADKVAKVSKEIKSVFGNVPVLYGGSVNPENITPYLRVTDGVLVGGASLDAEVFAKLIY